MDLYEYQGKQYFARFGIPVSPGGVADTVEEAVAGRGPHRLPGRREGPGAGRRSGQGRRGQARRRRRRGPRRTAEAILGLDIKGHVVQPALDRARLRHRQGVLRQLHPRPPAKLHLGMVLGRGRRRHRAGRRARTPRPSPGCTSTRCDGLDEAAARPGWTPPRLDDDGRGPAAWRDPRQALPLLRRGRRRPRRDQPAHPHARRPGARPRRQGDPRRRRRLPPPRVGRVRRDLAELDHRERLAKEKGLQYVGLDGYVGIIANGAGLAMSTCDVVEQVGGRAGQLPRHRRAARTPR